MSLQHRCLLESQLGWHHVSSHAYNAAVSLPSLYYACPRSGLSDPASLCLHGKYAIGPSFQSSQCSLLCCGLHSVYSGKHNMLCCCCLLLHYSAALNCSCVLTNFCAILVQESYCQKAVSCGTEAAPCCAPFLSREPPSRFVATFT